MNNLSGTIRYVLVAVAALLLIVGCSDKRFWAVQVRPGSDAGKHGCATINHILAQYDKSLYRIQTFKKGKLVSEKGTLSPTWMPEGLIAQVAREAKEQGFTGCAIEACDSKGTSSTNPHPLQTVADLKKLEEFVTP
jgi:hypothetical protein